MIPFLNRYEELTQEPEACLSGLIDYLESIAVDDLAPILLVSLICFFTPFFKTGLVYFDLKALLIPTFVCFDHIIITIWP